MNKLMAMIPFLPALAFSAPITNNITGVGPSGSIKPYICIQKTDETVSLKLAPGMTGDANQASGNPGYAGGAIRFDGCTKDNTYLGYIGFLISNNGNNAINEYKPPEGVHIALKNPAIDGLGHVTGSIEYTSIDENPNLIQAKAGKNWPFVGINLAGMEFGKVIDPTVIPNLSLADANSTSSDLKDTEAFIKAGINTVRVPISWGFLQLDGPGTGQLHEAYYDNYIAPLLRSLTQAKVHTIVDLHAYMRYSKFGEQISGCNPAVTANCPDGTLITDETAYQSIWGQLAQRMQKDNKIDKNYLMIDLMNEPVNVPDDKVFTIQAALIKMLQEQHFSGYILVEGNSWTGLHSWTTHQWTGSDGTAYTNAILFTRDNFAHAGVTDLSKVLINVHQYLDADYSGTHDTCLQDLSTTGPNGFNLNAFVDYLNTNQLQAIVTEFGTGRSAESCRTPLTQFMQYMQDNAAKDKGYGFVGWTIWSTGHGWGNYNLRVLPNSYQMDVLKQFL
ncbi:cellulase family glycosylhydrolase [Legionella sp.]|uniref:glycoside hydrolase family 5 protein n=1 Tax=Legionella sp. TaxID=459 RepID=UPI00321FD439